ncbi:MAG TPA: hypothetical protein VNB89_10875 [Gemmatimonadaceae bacterium]|nr:hypothetical protein [Gemmatimonadaceae bacterium]
MRTSIARSPKAIVFAAVLLGSAPVVAAQKAPDSTLQRQGGQLEQRVRQRIAAVVQNRLQLTDDQMRRLRDVNAKYEGQRRKLVTDERDARIVLRTELQRGKQGDQARISDAVDRMFKTQRARIDLAEQEQRDLSAFMTASQRAGYLALQEQIRRRVDEMRQRRPGGGRGIGGRGGPLGPKP